MAPKYLYNISQTVLSDGQIDSLGELVGDIAKPHPSLIEVSVVQNGWRVLGVITLYPNGHYNSSFVKSAPKEGEDYITNSIELAQNYQRLLGGGN